MTKYIFNKRIENQRAMQNDENEYLGDLSTYYMEEDPLQTTTRYAEEDRLANKYRYRRH